MIDQSKADAFAAAYDKREAILTELGKVQAALKALQ